jgi:hypothetical protein
MFVKVAFDNGQLVVTVWDSQENKYFDYNLSPEEFYLVAKSAAYTLGAPAEQTGNNRMAKCPNECGGCWKVPCTGCGTQSAPSKG